MGYEHLVKLDLEHRDGIDIASLAASRELLIDQLISDFLEKYETKYKVIPTPITEAAKKISHLYFYHCYNQVKPVIEDKSNRFKMAALMELIIVQEQFLFIEGASELDNRRLNAEFGLTAAFSMLNCMISDAKKEFQFYCCNTGIEDQVQKVIDDHELWLITKDKSELPVFVTAQFFELIEILLRAPLQIHG